MWSVFFANMPGFILSHSFSFSLSVVEEKKLNAHEMFTYNNSERHRDSKLVPFCPVEGLMIFIL